MDAILWTLASLAGLAVVVGFAVGVMSILTVFVGPPDELEYFSDDDW